MKKILLILLLAAFSKAFSQSWPVKRHVLDKRAARANFVQLPAFRFTANKPLEGRGIYQELVLDAAFGAQIMSRRPEALKLTIPLSEKQSITCELVKFDLGN